MSNTKRGFMKAGAIISIVVFAVAVLLSLIALSGISMVDAKFVEEILIESYPYELYTAEEIALIANLVSFVLICIVVYLLGFGIASLCLGIKVLKQSKTDNNSNGAIIALLVVSVFCNLITMAFMIVCLCLKNKSQQSIVVESPVETIDNSENK